MKLDRYTANALSHIAEANNNRRAWAKSWSEKSVEKLLAAGYVERREETTPGFCIWITDAGRAALREHQEGKG